MFDLGAKSRNRDFSEYIVTLAYVAEYKEWDNHSHIERIRRYCNLLANGYGIAPGESETIAYASQLHDVGKIIIPEALLKKKGNYEDVEWQIVERHTLEGAKILAEGGSGLFMMASTIAQNHHERWDGSGYPAGLKGEQIPLAGRITALADVYDALTTLRSYKQTLTCSEATQLIIGASGTLFDPKLVQVFARLSDEFCKIRQNLPD